MTRRSRELHPRVILVGGDLEVGKSLVVLEIGIEPRLDILDQPALHEERVDLALRLEVVDVADLADELRRSPVFGGGPEKIAPRAGPQVLRLADVDHPPRPILHEVDAGGGGERPHLRDRRQTVWLDIESVGVEREPFEGLHLGIGPRISGWFVILEVVGVVADHGPSVDRGSHRGCRGMLTKHRSPGARSCQELSMPSPGEARSLPPSP